MKTAIITTSYFFITLAIIFPDSLCQTGSGLLAGEVRMGSFGYKCLSDCEMKDGTDYFWCDAEHPTKPYKGDNYWDYCSREEDHDYRGVKCYIEHACGTHGYRYKWCYTSEDRSTWGYCGYKVQINRT